jgi:hypothetical protein
MALRIQRSDDNEATLVDEDGRALLDLVPVGTSGQEFSDLLARIEAALNCPALPRVAVGYREGLSETVQADIPCEVVLIEEDPFDEPMVTVRRRLVALGDPAGTAAAIARGEALARKTK